MFVCIFYQAEADYLEKWRKNEPKSDQKTCLVLEEQESNSNVHEDIFSQVIFFMNM